MGRKKKKQKQLELESVQLVFKPLLEREWLNMVANWAEKEVRDQLREGCKE